MQLKYSLDTLPVGGIIECTIEQAQKIRQACHNYGKRHNMYFRSKRKCKGGNIVITRIV